MMENLNIIETKLMNYVRGCRETPTTYAIAKNTGICWSTVDKYAYKLKDKGFISFEEVLIPNGHYKRYWHLVSKSQLTKLWEWMLRVMGR